MKTNYIAIIHKEENSAYGVSFPDFQGCITAGNTLDEAKDLAQEVLQFHVEGILEDDEKLPAPSKLEDVQNDTVAAYFVVGVKGAKSHAVRINATIDSDLLAMIDDAAKASGISRSAFLAAAAYKEIGDSRARG